MSEPVLRYPGPCRVARLLRREKRFFVFVELDGREVAAHTNNTGTMLGLLRPGSPVLLSPASNPARKLSWTVEALGLPDRGGFFWVGVNTSVPNRLLSALFESGLLPWAEGYTTLRREAVRGESRLDGVFRGEGLPDLWVECKNVTLVEDGAAAFPDAVTVRGAKHLRTLMEIRAAGERAAMLYIIQRPDGACFSAADYVDSAYAEALHEAVECGVEVYPVVVHIREDGIHYGCVLEYKRV
ncbi:MAG TPA: DNA/RNA nuclease SfsA [Mailhella massiliensis]|uniref:Sugar fermentation stimulation protein homolog n=1 Tax=Mailhella massiliensis TaxID=1903261 RepID=A0A921AXM3_9BACT|nr:DNA/RNA nuclease SfsA [Mailhella massiliensis]HJD97765.1 DNA/RNA nuclease SfsA [Mailhella massiliensis]